MEMELDDIETPRKRGSKIDEKTLDSYGFITGDLLSVSLYVPEPKISASAPRIAALGQMGQANSFGWSDRDRDRAPREAHPSDRVGSWSRGEPLPAQNFRGGAPARGGEPAGGGAWRGGGTGIRGAGRRPSETNGARRSRSPEMKDRRESSGRRRGD